jgi:hypothetical protein
MAAMEKKIAESGTNVSSEPSIHEGLTADAAAAAGTVATDVYVSLTTTTASDTNDSKGMATH